MSVALDHTCTLQLIIQRVGLVLLLDIGVTCYDDAWAWAIRGRGVSPRLSLRCAVRVSTVCGWDPPGHSGTKPSARLLLPESETRN